MPLRAGQSPPPSSSPGKHNVKSDLEGTLLESSVDCIKVLDLEGNLLSMSAAGQQLLEIQDITRYLNRSWVDLWSPDDQPRIRTAIQSARQGGTGHFQAYCASEAGTPRWWDVVISPISQPGDPPVRLLAVSRDITAQKQTERLLEQSRQQYHLLFHNMLNGFALCQMLYEEDRPVDFRFLEVNMMFESITGLKGVVTKRVTEVLPRIKETNPRLLEVCGRVAATSEPETIECHLPELGLWLSIAVHSPAKGTFSTIFEDITKRKLAEDALARAEERFRIVAESLSDVIYEWDLGDDIQWYGDTEVLYGPGASAFPRSRNEWLERLHPEDRPIVQLAVEGHIHGEIAFNCEYRIRTGDGQWRYWTDRGTVLRTGAGGPRRWVGSISDISDQVGARKALMESEKRYQTLYDTMRDAFVSVDLTGNIKECNHAYLAMLGYTREELDRTTYMDLTPPQWHALESHIVATEVLTRGYSDLYEKEYRGKDGRIFPVELRTILIRDGAGAPVGMWAIIRDITSRKHADEQFKASQERFRSTFEQAAVGIAHVAPDGQWIRLNERFCEIVGYPLSELQRSTLQTITHPEDLDSDLELVRQMLANERDRYSLEKRYIRRDQAIVWVHLTVSLVRDARGHPDYFISVIEDISDRKRLDQELRQLTAELERRVEERTRQLALSNKELESFSYSVAHDLRAPLRGIDGWSQALAQEYGPVLDERGIEYLSRVCNEAHRMGQLIDDMLLLSRVSRTELVRSRVDLSSLTERVAARVRANYPDQDCAVAVQPGMVLDGDPHLMDIVLTNLIDNAIKFTRSRAPGRVDIGQSLKNGAPCWFVKDNGVGFDMRYAAKLFSPFQRMHRQSDYPGTGIGLATVQRIISRHGGTVWIEAEKNVGTTVHFTL
jgi:PAS domain S-box-containing protein